MDVPASRRTSIDGAGQPARRTLSAAAKRHSWSGYNNGLRPSFAAPPGGYGQVLLRRVAGVDRDSASEDKRSHSAPSSRSPSPGARPSSRSGVPNFSRVLPPRNSTLSTIMEDRSAADSAESLRSRLRSCVVRRWEPTTRTVTPWDSLRRDPELWFQQGDCLVHLYAKGLSKRGPALRVPLEAVRANNLSAIFCLCFAQISVESLAYVNGTNVCELYIPAPDEYSKDAAFRWHLTTRNFFAFLFRRPLVGIHLGRTLIDLQERIHLFRPGNRNNHNDFMGYLDSMRYLDFAHCPDYSLGLLQFAEHYQLKELWIDAFAHCVGMNKILSESPEFLSTSRITQQLITNASLKQEIHLGEVTRGLSNFLEDELSPAHLGLSQGARVHLDHFRSFLHSFYIEKFNYWPPPSRATYPKSMYQSMYFDFRNLYDLLVDLESTDSLQDQRPASGGICVLQNVQAFDQRHKYLPLPHPLPLVPECAEDRSKTQSQRALRTLKFSSKQAKTEEALNIRTALAKATNSGNSSIMNAKLVKGYQRFEREWTRSHEEKVSIRDARKVRWLLIYSCLQMLVSAIRAPKEVRDVDDPAYPLSCLVPSAFPWEADAKVLNGQHVSSINLPVDAATGPIPPIDCKSLPSNPELTIHPDCETDDYFSHAHTVNSSPIKERPPSFGRATTASRSATNLLRNASVRSMKRLPLTARRKSNTVVKPPTPSFCEILVHGYGNGLNKTIVDPPKIPTSYSRDEPVVPAEITVSRESSVLERETELPDGLVIPPRRKSKPPALPIQHADIPEEQRTPLLNSGDLEKVTNLMHHGVSASPDSSDSDSATRSPHWSGTATPSSLYSQDDLPGLVHSGVTRNSSVLTTSSASATLSPVSLVEPERQKEPGGIIIKRSFSVDSFLIGETKAMDIQDASAWPAALNPRKKDADENILGVYQPTGLSLRKTFIKRRESLRSSFANSSKLMSEKRWSVRVSDGDLVEALTRSMP